VLLTFSISFSRYCWASAIKSAGMSDTSESAPIVSSLYVIAFIFTRSITPANLSSAPIGSWIATGLAPSFVSI